MWSVDSFKIDPAAETDNLLFYPDSVVYDLSGQGPEKSRILCIAELFSRWFLSRSPGIAELIDQRLPDGERSNLARLLDENFLKNPCRENLMFPLWNAKNDFSQKCQAAVRKKLIVLCCETDGFIPVYMQKKAYFLPFQFVEGNGKIRDAAGEEIANWQTALLQISGKDSSCDCIVRCRQRRLPELTGNSLLLPLFLAFHRKQGTLKYNHLRLLATGAVENGTLKAVETSAKAAGVKSCFKNAVFFFPESSRYCPSSSCEMPLAQGMTTEKLLKEMPAYIESQGLITPGLSDAMKRLEELEILREQIHNRWETFYKQVELYARNINQWSEPEMYMLCLMLKSAILCHMARTDEALKLNREAQQFAAGNNLEKPLRRMEIEELIELQDKELFPQISQLAEPLRSNIEKLEDPDLLMRYYGTMGQAHCYGCLNGTKGFDRDTALEYFKKAVRYAGKTGKLHNIAQDLNYIFLWYALFYPETPESEKAFSEAADHIHCNLQDNPEIQFKNRCFLNRIKAFSLYRHLLLDGKVSADTDFERFLLPDNACFWLRAVVNKYTGALYAHQGNRVLAEKLFSEAAALLDRPDPLTAFIKMTVLAESYRSLGRETDRISALELAESLKKHYLSAEKWINFLRGSSKFPGLEYWY